MENQLHNCKNCGTSFSGKFCNECGEKILVAEEKTLGYFLGMFFTDLFNLDSKFLKSLKLLFTHPGKLSSDFENGIRKRHFRPSALFLVLTAIYFIFSPFDLYDTPLKYHLEHSSYPEFAEELVQKELKERNLDMEQLSELYYAQAKSVAKWLILIFIPGFTLILSLLFFRSKKYLVDNIALSLEINSYNIFAHFLILPFIIAIIVTISNLINLPIIIDDFVVLPLITLSFTYFLFRAFKRFYGNANWLTALKVLLFIIFFFLFSMDIYRFLLLNISMALL